MEKTEKQIILEHLQETTAAMLEILAGVSEENFKRKPGPDQWSVAEVVEHVINVETGVVGRLKKMGENKAYSQFVEAPSTDKVIAESANRAEKVPSPAPLIPKGTLLTKKAAIEAFQKNRKEVLDFAEHNTLPLKEIVFPHPRLGMFNGENWLAFMAGHSKRHIEQINLLIN